MSRRKEKRTGRVSLAILLFAGLLLSLTPNVTLYFGEAESRREVEQFKDAFEEREDGRNGEAAHQDTKGGADAEPKLEADVIGCITIEAIGITYVVKEGAGKEILSRHIGHLPQTAAIGAKGNCVLAGHNGGRYGDFFKNAHKLKPGDRVELTDAAGEQYCYEVKELYVTDPYDWEVTADTGESRLTLVTCTGGGKNRLIVICKMLKLT